MPQFQILLSRYSANRFSLKYINQAMERLKAMPEDPDRELTVLEKLLITDPDPRTAMVMALDMMGAGIDTVIPSRGARCIPDLPNAV
jgi:hypothetical protein